MRLRYVLCEVGNDGQSTYIWPLSHRILLLTTPNASGSTLIGGATLLQLAGWARGFQASSTPNHHRSPVHHWIRPSSTATHAHAGDGGSGSSSGKGAGSSSSGSSTIESSRKGYFRTFDLAGAPPVDPIVRSQVRERLREKRREPFSKEKGLEVLQLLSDSRCGSGRARAIGWCMVCINGDEYAGHKNFPWKSPTPTHTAWCRCACWWTWICGRRCA